MQPLGIGVFGVLACGYAFARDPLALPGWCPIAQEREQPKTEEKPPAETQTEESKPEGDKSAEDRYAWVDKAVKRLAERAGLEESEAAEIAQNLKEALQQIEKIRNETEKALKDVVGEEEYQKIRGELRRILGGIRGPGGGQGPGGMFNRVQQLWRRIREELDLTDEQLKDLEPLVEEARQKAREIFEEVRGQGREGWRGLPQRIQEILIEFIDKAKEHLTEEQKTKLDEIVEEIRRRATDGRRSERQPERREGRRRPEEPDSSGGGEGGSQTD